MNKFRLSSNMYLRNEVAINAKSIYFLAVEGNNTEVDYFSLVNKYCKEIGLKPLIRVEVLQRRKDDTCSAPGHVLRLIEECVNVREGNRDEFIDKVINDLSLDISKFNSDFLNQYLSDCDDIDEDLKIEFENYLEENKYDLLYYCNLRNMKTLDGENDKYCVVIDRDCHSNTNITIKQCLSHCKEKNYKLLLSTPCFEFWLLLHLVSVESIQEIGESDIFENKHISNSHTLVSKRVSEIAGHGKSISESIFKDYYLENIKDAISKSKHFEIDAEQLIDHIGTNIGTFLEEIIG